MISVAFAILCALYDTGKRFTNHIPRFIFRLTVVTLISWVTNGNFMLNFSQNVAIFYFLFDYILNIMEDRKWNYIGNTAIHDIIWSKYLGGWIPQLIFKLIFLTITILIQ